MATINSIGSNIPIEITKGGTNATSFSTANGIGKYDGTRLVTSSTATIDASNRMTNTAQPAFLAFLPSTDLNKTGNGATFTIGSATALTEVFDQGGDFNVNGTFTAPTTGKYSFSFLIATSGSTAATTIGAVLTSSNRTFYYYLYRPATNFNLNISGTIFCDMDSADTITLGVVIYGDAGNTSDIIGTSPDIQTFFSGYLVC